MKRNFGPLLRASISLILILILLYAMRGRYGEIFETIKSADLRMFAFAFVFFTFASLIASYRMKIIIDAQDINIRYREALSLTFIGYFFNNFLPTAIGGDVVKAHYLSKNSGDTAGSYSSVFVDRVVGLVTMVFMAFTALLFVGTNIIDKRLAISIYVITALSALVIIFLSNKRFAVRFSSFIFLVKPIEAQLRKLYTTINKYRNHPGLMACTLLISVLSQLCFFASYGILALSIGSHVSPLDLLIKMPIVGVISLLPSINGLGVREGSIVLLFGPLIGKGNALAISILMVIILLMTSIIGGLIYAFSPQFKMKLKEIEIESEAL